MTDQITTIVVITQLFILALTFILIPIIAQKYGQKAQNAAEKAVADQGFEKELLLKNGVKMSESKAEMLLPLAFAIAYLIIAFIGITSGHFNTTLLWIVDSFTLLVVGVVTAQQVFVTSFLKRAFQKSKDANLRKIDVEAFISAALKEFPAWLQPLQVARFLAATVGSATVLLLLALSGKFS